jgi:molybdopterin converting factor small subunit
MVTVHIPSVLRKYCDDARALSVEAPSVRAALDEIARMRPALYRNICDETDAVRRHIGVFVNTTHIRDLDGLESALAPGDALTILPAVSGG